MSDINKNKGLVNNSNQPQQRKDELLVELKKNVPQIDWKFLKIETKTTTLGDGREWNNHKIHFEGIHKDSKDECFIIDEGGENDFICGYYHIKQSMYRGENSKWIYEDRGNYIGTPFKSVWDKINEFFNEYCIGFEGREEKIKSGDMITPNMEKMKSVGNYEMSKDEYSQGLLNLLLPYPNSYGFNGKTDIDYVNQSFSDFEKKYKELNKELNTGNDGGYFETPSEMIESFLDTKLVGELEYYLEQLWEEVEEEVREEQLETSKE